MDALDFAAPPFADALTRLATQLGRGDVRELFAKTAEALVRELHVERALVLSVDRERLTAADCGPIAHDPSDQLRRVALHDSIAITPRSIESAALGRADAARCARTACSTVANALALHAPSLAPVCVRDVPVALLVADRPGDPWTGQEHGQIQAFAAILGLAVDRALLDARVDAIGQELRHLIASSSALMGELDRAPLLLPSGAGRSPTLGLQVPRQADDADAVRALLTERETTVAERLVLGMSNREIAEELFIAPDTVKATVARVLRKRGAANRVEAVGRFLALRRPTDDD